MIGQSGKMKWPFGPPFSCLTFFLVLSTLPMFELKKENVQHQKLDPKCWLKWETSRELINEHEQKEIVYKFFVEHSEQMLEGVEHVKSEIFEAANNVSSSLKAGAEANAQVKVQKLSDYINGPEASARIGYEKNREDTNKNAKDTKSASKSEMTFTDAVKDEVTIVVPPRQKLIVKQLILDCTDPATNTQVFHAAGRNITARFVKLQEPVLPSVKEYKGELLRSMANQLFVTIDAVNRLVANFSYKYATELSDKQTFFISELQDKTKAIVLKSAHNGLHVCLDDNDLLAACNASIEGQNPARFSKLCHSHYKGLIMGVGPCKVFGLRCLENGRAVTVNLEHGSEDYGVLMANGPTWERGPYPRDINFYPMTFTFANRFKSEKANRVYYSFGSKDTGMYLQMTANGTQSGNGTLQLGHFVNETTFDKFPVFQRLHNNDGTVTLRAKNSDDFVMLENCTKFKFHQRKGLRTACGDKSVYISGLGASNPAAAKRNSFNFFGSPSQLRFYVAKKTLGGDGYDTGEGEGNLYFLLAENSDLPKWLGTTHYRPFKITGGQELHKETKFEKLLEVHNVELLDNDVGMHDKVNNKRFSDFVVRLRRLDDDDRQNEIVNSYLRSANHLPPERDLFLEFIGKANSDLIIDTVFLHKDFSRLNKVTAAIDAFPELFASEHSSGDNFLKGVTDNGREGILPLTYDQLATALAVELTSHSSVPYCYHWLILVPEHGGEFDSNDAKE